MKYFILLFSIMLAATASGQTKFLTKTGSVIFEASVPSFEEVKATNSNTTAILNTENGEFAALVLVKGFRFKNALMEEHFNENYAESDEFPKATFKGKIDSFSMDANSTKTYSGSLTFHGKTKELKNEKLSLSKNDDGSIAMSGTFKVDVDDFDIKIPKIVSNKLSKTVEVTFEFVLLKK